MSGRPSGFVHLFALLAALATGGLVLVTSLVSTLRVHRATCATPILSMPQLQTARTSMVRGTSRSEAHG